MTPATIDSPAAQAAPTDQRPLEALLFAAGWRIYAGALARNGYLAGLVVGGLAAVGLLVARLTALIPELPLAGLLALPGAALLIALALTRWPARDAVARRLDGDDGDDLLLTAVQLEQAPGGYKPLVLQRARERALATAPGSAVSWNWGGPTARLAALVALIVLGAWQLPQLDPYGERAERDALARKRDALEDQVKRTAKRKAELKVAKPKGALSDEVAKELAALKREMLAVDVRRPHPARKAMQLRQVKLGQQWRKANAKLLKNQLDKLNLSGRLGQRLTKTEKSMREALSKGNTKPMSQALSELNKLLSQLKKERDPEKKKALKRELQKKLKSLKRAAPKEMKDLLDQALDQLEMASSPALQDKALESLGETLKLGSQELERIGRYAMDKQAIENALAAIQKVKKLLDQLEAVKKASKDVKHNLDPEEQGKLEKLNQLAEKLAKEQLKLAAAALHSQQASEQIEAATELGKGLEEQLKKTAKLQAELQQATSDEQRKLTAKQLQQQIEKLEKMIAQMSECSDCSGQSYEALLASLGKGGKGNGPGTGGAGRGQGGIAPEKPDEETGFKTERSKTQLQRGRTLMKWRAKREVGPLGEAPKDYREAVKKLAEGVGEAIEAERVPAGYHEGVKHYFDQLKREAEGENKPDSDK